MEDFDRGVRASIVAHDMFYGFGHAVGLGLRQHRANQAVVIRSLRAENDQLQARHDVAQHNEAVWQDVAIEAEDELSRLTALFAHNAREYNALVDDYNGLLKERNDWITYADALNEELQRLRG